jgi:hypothetical protein
MPWRVAWALVQMLVFGFCGIVALTTDEVAWLNGSLRAGLTLFFLTNAVFPMVPQYGLVAKLLNISRGGRSNCAGLVSHCRSPWCA